MQFFTKYARRRTSTTHIGALAVGSDYPVRVQTMANVSTNDVAAGVAQAKRCIDAGAEIVRFTAQGLREVESLRLIHDALHSDLRYAEVPLVADVHFRADVAFEAARVVEKVRINPGNFAASPEEIRTKFLHLIRICKEHHTALRIGVNHGSLSQRILEQYGDTPEGMVVSCMEFLRIAVEAEFQDIVLSVKASDTLIMIETVRALVEAMDQEDMHFPLHLGVTEAGEGEDGRIKSAVGIGTLLAEGIGDTIRVSLSEEPEAEIPVAQAILQACGIGRYKTEFVSCPSCGRTMFDLPQTVRDIKAAIAARPDLDALHLKIGIMGCIVNGPGEMAGADYGYVGAGKGQVSLYRGQECVLKHIPQAQAVDKLLELMERGKLKAERGKLKVESSIQKSEISIK